MDRRELSRAYKETSRPMGVFRVRNTVNGKCFIGTSVDLPSMLNRQRALEALWLEKLSPYDERGYNVRAKA